MSVIIRLQNLPWSANALDIRNFFRGLSIPEGGVHIVGGELGDAFIAFSTDEDARQAMMLDCGKIKEIQVKLLLSSRSEMHKVIEAARQNVPILSLTAPTPPTATVAPVVTNAQLPTPSLPTITPFSAALGNNPLANYGIPGIGNPQEIPQPAVIEPPAPLVSPSANVSTEEEEKEPERKRSREKDRRRTRSRSRSRDRKDRKRDRRDRSRSRERRRRDRSRSRDRRDRKRDRKDRSRSRDRTPTRRSRDRRNDRRSPYGSQEKNIENSSVDNAVPSGPSIGNPNVPMQQLLQTGIMPNGMGQNDGQQNLYNDPTMTETFNKLQELGKKRNPNAFQGDPPNGNGRFQPGRGGNATRDGASNRREGRPSRFENDQSQRDCCVAIKNAPNYTSYGDVRRFFPFMIDKHGIKMINDNMGRRTGTIYVRFCDPRSKQLALQRKINELKNTQVIVEALDDEAYDSAVDSFLPYREENDDEDPTLVIADNEESQPPFTVLKLSDLPNFVKEHDIIKAFSDFSLLSIALNDCRVTRSKIAFVQFVKPEDAKIAYERRERYIFGRRQPTIETMTNEDYEKERNAQSETSQDPKRSTVKAQEQPEAPVVPRDPRQRRQFGDKGQKSNPQQTGPPGPQGPTQPVQGSPFFNPPFMQQQGFAAAPFGAPQFGGYPGPAGMDPRAAAANWVARPNFPNQMNQIPGPQMVNTNVISSDLDDEPLDCVLMKGLPRQNTTDRTIVTFLADTNAVPARIHLMLDVNGLPSGDCFCEFRSPQEARMAATKHGQNLDGCRVTVDLVARSVVEEALEPKPIEPPSEGILGNGPVPQFYDAPRGGFVNRGPYRGGRGGFDSNRGFDSSRGFDRGGFRGGFDQGRGNYRGRGFDRGGRGYDRGRGRGFGRGRGSHSYDNNRDARNEQDEQDPALEDFGAPGCVVSMENVPFRASIDDIMNFFSEFELTQDDVIRRFNERGQPTGDARVAFRTPFDAQRAVKTRHMDMIHDRRISLTIL